MFQRERHTTAPEQVGATSREGYGTKRGTHTRNEAHIQLLPALFIMLLGRHVYTLSMYVHTHNAPANNNISSIHTMAEV